MFEGNFDSILFQLLYDFFEILKLGLGIGMICRVFDVGEMRRNPFQNQTGMLLGFFHEGENLFFPDSLTIGSCFHLQMEERLFLQLAADFG